MVLNDFPAKSGSDREEKIIQYVKNKKCEYKFSSLFVNDDEDEIELLVFEDALKIDGIRINASAETQQKIADLLNCMLPTAKIYDLMWHNCKNKINPNPRQISMSTEAMIDHSRKIDKQLEELGNPEGIKATVGKTWIIDNSLIKKNNRACNYGWHFTTGTKYKGIRGNACASLLKNPETNSYWYMIQSRGWHHNRAHADYSQTVILVSKQCFVNGKEMILTDVLKSPKLAPLINHDGILNIFRQPDVEELEPIIDFPIKINIPEVPTKPCEAIDRDFIDNNDVYSIRPPPITEEELDSIDSSDIYSIKPPPQSSVPNVKYIQKANQGNNILTLIMTVLKFIFSLFSRK